MYCCIFLRPGQGENNSGVLRACAARISPLFEVRPPDLVLVDLRGLGKLWGSLADIAAAIEQEAGAEGLDVNVAIANNLDAAIAAAKGFRGITVIPFGQEGTALAPLSVALLAHSEDAAAIFESWGIRTFGELAALPEKGLAERLGAEGLYLQKLARGWMNRPLIASLDGLQFEDVIELEHPLELLEPLSFLLSRLLNELTARLRQQALATNHITTTLGLEDGTSYVRELNLPFANTDAAGFLKLLQYDFAAHPPTQPIVRVGIKLTPVPQRTTQHGLFTPLAPEPEKLELTLARIHAIVGEGNAGTPEVLNTHRPDAYRMVNFDPAAAVSPEPAVSGYVALRRFRPPLPARVETQSLRPERIAARGITGKIVEYAGPWRTSGDWWRSDSWNRDEWDVGLDNGTLYRIFCDSQGNWFIDANYD